MLDGTTSEEESLLALDEFESSLDVESGMEEGNSDSPEFYVAQVELLAANVIAVYLNPDPMRAEMSGQTLETILSSFDFRLSGSEAEFVRPGEPQPPVGPLQRLEHESQWDLLESARSSAVSLSSVGIRELRAACAPGRDAIISAVERLAEVNGWDTH
ncbi:hypothetical protein [Streptomyces cavernicola]|uniref:Uncharacterized protein n=1 Tax=Streptomyces cavernicola TaxID=3043613 RepID=A0ABT6SJR7_9ACTN|nr:hypothetical protein [Streptomyces sp. B-S-A6]MDI3408436.1 hypothetical protein [Streptomyces sp. B-S-A6]